MRVRIPKYIVTLNLPEQVPELVAFGRTMVLEMSPPNPWFTNLTPALSPALATVSSHIDDLALAETTARTRAAGAVAVRDEKKVVVEKDLGHLRGAIQVAIDQNPGHEEAIAKSAGVGLKKRNPRQKRVFRAMQGPASGNVDLEAAYAGRGATHYWQMSLNQKDWTSLPETLVASTGVTSLTPGTLCFFRHRALTRKGLTDWDQVVSIMPH